MEKLGGRISWIKIGMKGMLKLPMEIEDCFSAKLDGRFESSDARKVSVE